MAMDWTMDGALKDLIPGFVGLAPSIIRDARIDMENDSFEAECVLDYMVLTVKRGGKAAQTRIYRFRLEDDKVKRYDPAKWRVKARQTAVSRLRRKKIHPARIAHLLGVDRAVVRQDINEIKARKK